MSERGEASTSFSTGMRQSGNGLLVRVSEIYPIGVRGAAMSVSTIANWGANFLVAATFLTLSGAITRQGTFFLYAGVVVLALVFFALKVPETRGKSLEDIQEELVEPAEASEV